jgi:hypothetical protein
MTKATSIFALAVIASATATAYVPAASAEEAAKRPYYPSHYGEFEDGVGYYYDSCKFDGYPGKYVKFETKQIAEYPYGYYAPPVYYTLLKATCKVPVGYKAKKKIVYYNFPCKYTDKNYYPDETTIDTYYSKFEIKKRSNYGTLTCKFKTENEPAPVAAEPETLE